jgi:hypothetical protein
MSQLILLVEFNDLAAQIIRCSTNEEADYHFNRLKKDSSVLTLELVDAITISSWDNPSPSIECWFDETEL